MGHEEFLATFRLEAERTLCTVAGGIKRVARGGAPLATLGELAYKFNHCRGGAMTLGLDALADLSWLAEELALKLAFPAGEEHLGRGLDLLTEITNNLMRLVSAPGSGQEEIDSRISGEATRLLEALGGPRQSLDQEVIGELFRELQEEFD